MTDTRTIVEELFAVIDGHRFDDVDAVLRPDAEMNTPLGQGLTPAAWVEHSRGFARAFPDGGHTLVRAVSAGDRCAIEGVWSGTHTGPMASPAGVVPPTGRGVTLPFCGVHTVRDGRIAAMTIYFDQMTMLVQLGLVPEPAATH
jgi:predicted ester cyclase